MNRQRYMKDYRAAYKTRVKVIKVALDNGLYAELAERARADGKPPTTLARELIATSLSGDTRVPEIVAAELRRLQRLVRSIANNLNQLAHHANTVRRVVDVQSIFTELKRLDAAVRAFTLKRLD